MPFNVVVTGEVQPPAARDDRARLRLTLGAKAALPLWDVVNRCITAGMVKMDTDGKAADSKAADTDSKAVDTPTVLAYPCVWYIQPPHVPGQRRLPLRRQTARPTEAELASDSPPFLEATLVSGRGKRDVARYAEARDKAATGVFTAKVTLQVAPYRIAKGHRDGSPLFGVTLRLASLLSCGPAA